MESISHLIVAVKAFLILAGVLYAFLGQPIIVLNELRREQNIPYRGLWFIATLIIGPLATVPFGMFFSDKKWVKQASDVAAVITVIVGFLYWKYGQGLGLV